MPVALASSMLFRLFFHTQWRMDTLRWIDQKSRAPHDGKQDPDGAAEEENKSEAENERNFTYRTLWAYLMEVHPSVVSVAPQKEGDPEKEKKETKLAELKKDIEEEITFSLSSFLDLLYDHLVAPHVQTMMHEWEERRRRNGAQQTKEEQIEEWHALRRWEHEGNWRRRREENTGKLEVEEFCVSPSSNTDDKMSHATGGSEKPPQQEEDQEDGRLSLPLVGMWQTVWKRLWSMRACSTAASRHPLQASMATPISSASSSSSGTTTTTMHPPTTSLSTSSQPRDAGLPFGDLPVSPWMVPRPITFDADKRTWIFTFSQSVTMEEVQERAKAVRHTVEDKKKETPQQKLEQGEAKKEDELPSSQASPVSFSSTAPASLVALEKDPVWVTHVLLTYGAVSTLLFHAEDGSHRLSVPMTSPSSSFTFSVDKEKNMNAPLSIGNEKEKIAKEEQHRRLNEDPFLQLQPEFAGVILVFLRRLTQQWIMWKATVTRLPSAPLSSPQGKQEDHPNEKKNTTTTTPFSSLPSPPFFPLRWTELTRIQQLAVGILVQVLGLFPLAPLKFMALEAAVSDALAQRESTEAEKEQAVEKRGEQKPPSSAPCEEEKKNKNKEEQNTTQNQNKNLPSIDPEEAESKKVKKEEEEDSHTWTESEWTKLMPIACEKCGTLGHKRRDCMFTTSSSSK